MKNINLYKSVLSTVLISGIVFAEPEVTGKLTFESASFTSNGVSTGASSKSNVNTTHGTDTFKSEASARIYIDGNLEDERGSTYHVELQAFNDSEAVSDYDSNESYTQRDPLREAYVDTGIDDWLIRVGKQQVVWGTADGMKLLDAINPTDYSEIAQNQMEDSRIPVWMINADKTDENGGNWQFIISESRSSHIAGMGNESATASTSHSTSDQGHPFIMKGSDTISGKVNGVLNIVPAMASVSNTFHSLGNASVMTQATVDSFIFNAGGQAAAFAGICTGGTATSASCLDAVTNNTINQAGSYAANNQHAQNLMDIQTLAEWKDQKASPTQTFAYMPYATFATFDQFVNAKSKYVVKHDDSPIVAARYKNTTADGLNYSLNLIHGNDTNPYVETRWETTSGAVLTETASTTGSYTTNLLGDGTTVGGSVSGDTGAVYVMEEKLNKITQIGGSFDTSVETEALGPIVIRGEAVYQKDVMSPVVTRKDSTGADLEHGFLVTALKMTKGDRLKYVLGADITALTNMMVSFQFIQDRNLDYVDTGNKDATNWKYTADMATMSLTNNLNKAEKNKEFYSLYLSKPYGESGQHRWNNIFIFEENGGKWNRLDTEYTIDDNTIATIEYNKYWGNENTQFGQFKDSSNVQVGLKYTF
jgi:hypothetical protein